MSGPVRIEIDRDGVVRDALSGLLEDDAPIEPARVRAVVDDHEALAAGPFLVPDVHRVGAAPANSPAVVVGARVAGIIDVLEPMAGRGGVAQLDTAGRLEGQAQVADIAVGRADHEQVVGPARHAARSGIEDEVRPPRGVRGRRAEPLDERHPPCARVDGITFDLNLSTRGPRRERIAVRGCRDELRPIGRLADLRRVEGV